MEYPIWRCKCFEVDLKKRWQRFHGGTLWAFVHARIPRGHEPWATSKFMTVDKYNNSNICTQLHKIVCRESWVGKGLYCTPSAQAFFVETTASCSGKMRKHHSSFQTSLLCSNIHRASLSGPQPRKNRKPLHCNRWSCHHPLVCIGKRGHNQSALVGLGHSSASGHL